MKIGIDARFYGPLGKGLGRYTQKLIENLERIESTKKPESRNHYLIFLKKENWVEYQPFLPNFQKILANYHWYTLEEQILFPLKILKFRPDLMHFPHFNVPLFYPGKFVVTIHDLILTKFPTKRATTLGPLLYKLKYLGYQINIAQATRRARKIITVSEFTKGELINHFHLRADKIIVTHEAADLVEAGQLKLPETDLTRYGITQPFLLYVGNAYPHKNLEGLLEVFKKLKQDSQFNYQLVLVGKEDYFYRRLKNEAENLGLLGTDDSRPVIFFGFASQEILADLYRNASLYIFPSFYEGFGLPALEAMSYGLPVVASQKTALPEILGPAARYFNPADQKEMIEVIKEVLNDQKLKKELTLKGLNQVKKYSWRDCAEKTREVYSHA